MSSRVFIAVTLSALAAMIVLLLAGLGCLLAQEATPNPENFNDASPCRVLLEFYSPDTSKTITFPTVVIYGANKTKVCTKVIIESKDYNRPLNCAIKKTTGQVFIILLSEQFEQWIDRKNSHRSNLRIAYTILFSFSGIFLVLGLAMGVAYLVRPVFARQRRRRRHRQREDVELLLMAAITKNQVNDCHIAHLDHDTLAEILRHI